MPLLVVYLVFAVAVIVPFASSFYSHPWPPLPRMMIMGNGSCYFGLHVSSSERCATCFHKCSALEHVVLKRTREKRLLAGC